MRYITLYRTYLAMAIKAKLSYRVDLLVGMFSFMLRNIVNFFTIFMIFNSVVSLGDWTIDRMVFLYAFSLIPKGIDHVFTDAIWYVSHRFVAIGEIDKFLVRPVNPLFQLISSEFQYEGFGEVLLGVIVIVISLPKQTIQWSWNNAIPFILCGIFATFVFTGVKLFFASIAFFTKRSIQVMTTVYEMSDFARFPIEVFGDTIKNILLFIIPFGLVIYYPVKYLLEGKDLWGLTALVALVTVVLNIIAYQFWKFGLSKYESTGS